MASEEINKPKAEKTSASVTSTLPRVCPTTEIYSKDTSYDTERVKDLCQKSRPVSDEIKKRPSLVNLKKINLHKSILTKIRNPAHLTLINVSLTTLSPKNYHGLIPIPKKPSSNLVGMSPPVTNSPSLIKKNSSKEKPSNKMKTITFDQDGKKKTKSMSSRSSSPNKETLASNKKGKPTSTSPRSLRVSSEKTTIIKRGDSLKQNISPRLNSPPKRKPKTKVSSSSNVEFFGKEKLKKEAEELTGEVDSIVLKQISQSSLYKKESVLQPQEKISLDHLKNEVYSGDRKRLSFEQVHFCIENGSLAESKRSYQITYSAENLNKQKGISLAFVQNIANKSLTNLSNDSSRRTETSLESKNTIRTLSGEELPLSPSMNLEMENTEIGCDDLEISKLLHESEKNFKKNEKHAHIIQDDANEYDSEISTDGESVNPGSETALDEAAKKSSHTLWNGREADLLNDVDYRQSVYHPTISRRQEMGRSDYRSKSKSVEDNDGFGEKEKEKVVRTRSSQFKYKNVTQKSTFSTDKEDASNDGSWCRSLNKSVDLPMYNPLVQEVPLYESITGVERIRTKRQRLSGAMLRFTLKIIRLLALFDLWPGDFCHMLTSQSLRLAK